MCSIANARHCKMNSHAKSRSLPSRRLTSATTVGSVYGLWRRTASALGLRPRSDVAILNGATCIALSSIKFNFTGS
ncbi:hypothetical protein I7I50_00348 [Histoplasma capsulatum G186AR]|uniref:Uncharacterized protein n=1 Tax=Ajellomyces capsulatus TaxID=5037 RepID=A0A8H7YDT4_AJECA|nr:hypothetical protein I7I52_07616 [Histoplasma capsulatum]QSS72487.1 hypothetical protein I7I50_00348 [Histoplasma capsulatum G186AR]